MLNSLQSSDILKSECGRSIEPLTSLLATAGIVKHVDTAQTHKKHDHPHLTLRYFVEIMDNNYEITFLCDVTGKSL